MVLWWSREFLWRFLLFESTFLKSFRVHEVLTDSLLHQSFLKKALFIALGDLLSFHEKNEKQPFKSSCARCC